LTNQPTTTRQTDSLVLQTPKSNTQGE